MLANYSDETSLRTAVAFYMGSMSCLAWTPCSHFVELYLNGENQGIYQLTEQIKISKNRVNISEAGCLLEVDHTWSVDEDDVWFESDSLLLNIKDPKMQYGDDQYNWVSSYVKVAEDVLYSENFEDKDIGYSKYFDIESFVDWYVISEITKNYDSQFHYSCWMSVEPGGKIKMGPLWDFDLCMGNKGWGDRKLPEQWCQPKDFWLKGNTVWIDRMLEDDVFYEKVVDRMSYYAAHVDDICSFIDEQSELIKDQIIRNEKLWHTLNSNSSDDESIYDSYRAELTNLKQWIITRMKWLCDEYKAQTTVVTNVNIYQNDNYYIDLLGRKVVRPNRGLYIVNGKKVINL